TSAPIAASLSAKARPSPRPAPVTNATLPLSVRAPSCDAMMSSPGCECVSLRRTVRNVALILDRVKRRPDAQLIRRFRCPGDPYGALPQATLSARLASRLDGDR